MKNFSKIIFMLLMLCIILPLAPAANAERSTLTSKPTKCVSLKQGTICYQDVLMKWQTEQKDDYCLYNQAQAEALKCWHQLNNGVYEFEFSYPQTQQYVLRIKGQNSTLAKTVIEVKWVYKARRNKRFNWRVF